MRIGLISDTHGLLRPEALAWLRGSDRIVHAGDIGGPEILEALAALAPLTVVRGNNDRASWAASIPERADLVVGGVWIHAVHDVADFVRDAGDAPRVVVAGHSHRAAVRERDGVLHVNPGSAGPRRFKLPVSAGELVIEGGAVVARTVDLIA